MAASPGSISVQMLGDAMGVERMLESLDAALSNFALMAFLSGEVAPWLSERAKSRFASEGDDVSGGTWVPLEATTENVRRMGREQGLWAVGDAHPINVRTGELQRYITSGNGQTLPLGGDGAVLTYPRPTTNKELKQKIKTAQVGGQAPNARRPTPARPVLGISTYDASVILVALAHHTERYARARLT